jgi:hypothetical protein
MDLLEFFKAATDSILSKLLQDYLFTDGLISAAGYFDNVES